MLSDRGILSNRGVLSDREVLSESGMLVRTRALRAFFTSCCQISLAVETATPVASFIFSKVIGVGRLQNTIITAQQRGDTSFPISN